MLMHFLDPEKFADPEVVAQEFHDLNHQEQVGGVRTCFAKQVPCFARQGGASVPCKFRECVHVHLPVCMSVSARVLCVGRGQFSARVCTPASVAIRQFYEVCRPRGCGLGVLRPKSSLAGVCVCVFLVFRF